MRKDLIRALETLRRGGPGAIEEALASLQETVFSFSMKICGNREDAQDTMQKTLLKVVSRMHRFEDPKALAVWLYKVAKTQCLMSRRKSVYAPKVRVSFNELNRGRRIALEPLARPDSTPEDRAMQRERRQLVRQAVMKLPPSHRLPLVLHDMEELSTRNAADILGITEGTLRVRLHRARLFLRKELAGVFSVDSEPRRPPALPSLRCRRLIAEFSKYLDRELDDALCGHLERHLDSCEPCRAFLTTLQRTIEECRRHRSEGAPPRPTAAMLACLLDKYQAAADSLRRAKR
jgi:RNA polymerase sigma-70 factor (ECF subfamily)